MIFQALYSRLFDWIVESVNRAMASLSANSQTKQPLCIGVLDIFGFEVNARFESSILRSRFSK